MKIAAQLDGLPLAITQVARFIRREKISIQEFADHYSTDARRAEIHDFNDPLEDTRYNYTLATIYNIRDLAVVLRNC